ncbi:ATP-binding protein [Desulfosediminicola sp.]|uniref:ATP-binding protein n=1 Tax=Desulfosediminicola sp. TaxID=2886825 RepID=UPI003AF29CD1
MFRSINSKFYAVVVLLILSFSLGYMILAYSRHQQLKSAEIIREAILLEHDMTELNTLFLEARLWEKNIFRQQGHQAHANFGSHIEEIRELLDRLGKKELPESTQITIRQIILNIDTYKSDISKLMQLSTNKSLHETRMESNYRSLASIILNSSRTDFLKPLFNLTHFFITYRATRDLQTYQALILVAKSLEKKVRTNGPSDIRMEDYLQTFEQLLNESYAMELEIKAINSLLEENNRYLQDHFLEISEISNNLLQESLEKSDTLRQEFQRFFVISSILGTFLVIFTLLIIFRNIIIPIRSIATVMHNVKRGKISERFTGGGNRKDELNRFGYSFNEMLDTLENNNRRLIGYQRELENKIQELSAREKEQQRLTRQLQRAEKMEAIGTLAGGVAHDLNNILSGVVSYPELLLLDMPKDSPYRDSIEIIHDSGQKAAAIVQDLLTLARRGVAVTKVVNLNEIIEEYLRSPHHHKLVMQYNEIVFETDLAPDLFNITGSPIHLSKTVMNLISNGAEAISGMGRISIHTENRYISTPIVGYDNVKQGDYVVLSVSDSGSGIAPKDLERIFEPFFTKKVMGISGTGLGLAVVWGTVKDHNGYIDVESEPGKGTTFSLYFPVSREEIAEEEITPSIKTLMGKGERILIVDDIETQRTIATSMLKKLGYQTTSVPSGEEAIEFIKHNTIELILLDMLMPPGMDGLETYTKILKIKPDQTAIIASGYSETERVKEAEKLGAALYIKKPYSLADIGKAVQKALASSGSTQD